MSSPKENFWIGAKGGLLDRKHLHAMGEAVWLFLYLLMRQTQVSEAGEGIVLYGKPLTRAFISKDAGGWPERRIKDWTARLVKHGYIREIRSGNDGMIFFIRKAKSKARNPKPNTLYFPSQCKSRGETVDSAFSQVGRKTVPLGSRVGRETVQSQTENRPTCADNGHASQSDAGFPTTLTPKNLSNYNKDPLAKNARSDFFSLLEQELGKQKSLPRRKTHRELDERRRFLLRQGEELQAKYAQAH